MIPTELALRLRAAGLAWQPQERDCFAIPDPQFEGQIFCLNYQPALIELLHGHPAITFHGSSEWALDHLYTSEVVWIPTETQLRAKLEQLLVSNDQLDLTRVAHGYRCSAGPHVAEADDAEQAYALALLHTLMTHEPR
jgi:hypothetical protein